VTQPPGDAKEASQHGGVGATTTACRHGTGSAPGMLSPRAAWRAGWSMAGLLPGRADV